MDPAGVEPASEASISHPRYVTFRIPCGGCQDLWSSSWFPVYTSLLDRLSIRQFVASLDYTQQKPTNFCWMPRGLCCPGTALTRPLGRRRQRSGQCYWHLPFLAWYRWPSLSRPSGFQHPVETFTSPNFERNARLPVQGGGGGGIRTHGPRRAFSFQDWHHKPLGHASKNNNDMEPGVGFEPTMQHYLTALQERGLRPLGNPGTFEFYISLLMCLYTINTNFCY